MEDIKKFVVEWFAANTAKSKDEILQNLNADYLHYGWLDSFKFISFIAAAEKEFGIAFSNDDYRDEKFSTVEGLINVIATKSNA